MLFAHVEDDRLREILTKELTDEDSICYALTETGEAIRMDGHNEDVDHAVYNARLSAFSDASDWWNEEGDAFKAIESLQLAWNV